MRPFLTAVVVLASVLVAARPAAATWGIGANLGVTIHNPDSAADNTTLVGIPTQASAFATIRPGMRVSYTGAAMDHEGFADLSYDSQSSGGDHINAFRLAGNYQYNFSTSGGPRPYVTAGVGLFHEGVEVGSGSVGATSMTFGGGFGVGFPVSKGSGRIRVEARIDELDEGDDDGDVVIGKATVMQIGAGFDLWFR
jgi:outer membrane protein with beta-barrel domain